MQILVACEESQEVTKAFRALGHEAYSCDILECSGGHPEWHIQDDVLDYLDLGWDMILAFPPCTYLCVTANKWLKDQPPRKSGVLVGAERRKAQDEATEFFMQFANAPAPYIAIENPISVMSTRWRKPDQIIQPWMFGDAHVKKTCLWLKGLPLLVPTKIVEPQYVVYHSKKNKENKSKYPLLWKGGAVKKTKMPMAWKMSPSEERSRLRAKTFPGVAKAMAQQWGNIEEE